MPWKPVDIYGKRFKRLLVKSYAGKSKWHCLCDCGNASIVATDKLNSGHTTSCGCRQKETAPERCRSHGLSKTPTYRVWAAVKRRCTNPHCSEYPRYGGRGIEICDRWMDFENFLTDMGEAPQGLDIDREDNDGHYEPGNCKWATRQVNSNNRRNNRFIEWQGEKLTLAQWAKRLGIKPHTLQMRLSAGWSVEQAMTQPVRPKKPH